MNEAKLLTEAIKDLQENYRILGNKQYRVRNKQYTVTKFPITMFVKQIQQGNKKYPAIFLYFLLYYTSK